MNRRLQLLLAVLPLLVAAAAVWALVPRTSSVTCTNTAAVTRTWTSTTAGSFAGPGSASAEAVGPSAYPDQKGSVQTGPVSPAQELALKQKAYVTDAIANGLDPVTAARQFGPWTLPSGATAAEMAHAMDPATYGWHC